MDTSKYFPAIGAGVALCILLFASSIHAADTIRVKNQAVDKAELNTASISKDSPLHVQLFDTAGVNLGNH